jgi:hypothetical protein
LIVWANSRNRAITGLDALIEDNLVASFQNVSTTEYPQYTSLVLDGGGTAQDLTPTLFRQVLAGLLMKSGDEKPANGLKVWTNPYQMINLEELYEGEYRTGPSDNVAGMAITTFQTALGKLSLMADSDAPFGTIFFADGEQIKRSVMKDLYWRRDDKGSFFTVDQNSLNYRASCVELADMRIHSRHTSAKITNLNETAVTPY